MSSVISEMLMDISSQSDSLWGPIAFIISSYKNSNGNKLGNPFILQVKRNRLLKTLKVVPPSLQELSLEYRVTHYFFSELWQLEVQDLN